MIDYLKNIPGWSTNKKYILFTVDDYGNVRLESKKAKAELSKNGFSFKNRFDAFDSLETKQDLEALYEVLDSFHDIHGNSAVFTAYSLPCNINFEQMENENYTSYRYELLPETFDKLSSRYPNHYNGAWKLWKEGLNKHFLVPQFHGREHFNLKYFEECLSDQSTRVLNSLRNRSLVNLDRKGWTAAFSFNDKEETNRYSEIITSGLDAFHQVFDFRPSVFTPPAQQFPIFKEDHLVRSGIQWIDRAFYSKHYLGDGKFKRELNYLGKLRPSGLKTMVRNVVFEPCDNRGFDWVNYTLKQIEASFLFNKPAIISSHRVNYSGFIDEENRKTGLKHLKQLLTKVTRKWPDVEFISTQRLAQLISVKQS